MSTVQENDGNDGDEVIETVIDDSIPVEEVLQEVFEDAAEDEAAALAEQAKAQVDAADADAKEAADARPTAYVIPGSAWEVDDRLTERDRKHIAFVNVYATYFLHDMGGQYEYALIAKLTEILDEQGTVLEIVS